MADAAAGQRVGVVVIGRNEGERLRICLTSVLRYVQRVAYVDSGSTDASVEMARGLKVDVVELDMSIPFTAARARNEGFRRLTGIKPELDYVQFVDGDCEVVEGWMDNAVQFLDGHPEVAVVCGRRRERFPERSVYNLLCDIEWDTPIGEARACGGDAMMRVGALTQVGGYREDLIAGEEPELCLRMRLAGWMIWRLDAEMTRHDAAMLKFGQWWKRNVRGGHAFAESAYLHGSLPERPGVRESVSAWLWGAGIPVAAFGTTLAGLPGWALLAVYPLQVVRLGLALKYDKASTAWKRSVFLVLGKFPEALGQFKFHQRRVMGARPKLIEYK